MTSVQAPPLTGPVVDPLMDPAADPAAGLHASLDELFDLDLDGLGAQGQERLLRSLARAEARIAALRSRVLAVAVRCQTAARSGAASTGQWAASVTRTDAVTAQRQVGLAQGLERRRAAREALSAGVISAEHAAVIVQADRNLPAGVSAVQREVVEAGLVAKAQTLTPTALRRAARRAWEAIEPDVSVVDAHENTLLVEEEDRARARTRLSLHDNGDGTVSGHFTIPAAQGELLRKVIEAITAPRRGRLGASHAQIGDRDARTDWDRARGEALVELIEHLPVDHLHPKTAATLVITLSDDILRGALRAAGLDTGGSLSAGEVRRLACSAHLIPAVLDGTGRPLDLGRSQRLFNQTQRIALSLTHHTCAAEGCERPFAWCELHHLVAWALGGKTDLTNAVPLCHFHHQRIHDHRYRHTRAPDGSLRFHLVT